MKQRTLLLLVALLVVFVSGAYAQTNEATYDKYQVDSKVNALDPPSTLKKVLDSPSLGVTYIKSSLRKFAVWLETYHVYDKNYYIYKEITKHGIYPIKTHIGDRHGDPAGVEFNYGIYPSRNVIGTSGVSKPLSIQYNKEFEIGDTPIGDTIELNGWTQFAFSDYHDYGFQFTLNDFIAQDNYLKSTLRYQDSHKEDYFGQGPNLSIADGMSFSLDEVSYALAIGREIAPQTTLEFGGVVSSVDVSEARDNDKRHINTLPSTTPGIKGADLFGIGISLEHDTRDSVTDPHTGGFQRLKIGHYEGINGDDFGYTKYRFDIAEFFPIGEYLPFLYWDSVIAVRAGGEYNDDLNDDAIPFFDLARLGGAETVRGFQYNRFFDEGNLFYGAEYRYNIWGMRQYKVDATIFYDGGWIFDEITEIELQKHKGSYGIGFRFIFPRVTFLMEGAHSSEGTEFYIKANPIF